MSKDIPKVFISYCSRPSINLYMASSLVKDLNDLGISTIFDENDLIDWDNIEEFMSRVKESTVVVLLINPEYLCSRSCMNECLLAFEQSPNKILPVILDPTIFDKANNVKYIHYWNKKIKEQKKETSSLEYENEIKYINIDTEKYEKIAERIPCFLHYISTSKSPELKDAADSIYKHLKKLGYTFPEQDLKMSSNNMEANMCTNMDMDKDRNTFFSNKNELINWYFYDPINQLKEQCSSGCLNRQQCFFIDMWKMIDPHKTPLFHIDLTSSGIKCILEPSAKEKCYIYQMLENPGRMSNTQLTLSIETTELYNIDAYIEVLFNTKDSQNQVVQQKITKSGIEILNFKTPKDVTAFMVRIVLCNQSSVNSAISGYAIFGRIKLENGNKSTLQNDLPPIKYTELLKCQRYFYILPENTYIRASAHIQKTAIFRIDLPIPMRINPAVANFDNLKILDFNNFNKELEQNVYVYAALKGTTLELQVRLQDDLSNLPSDPVLFIGKDVYANANF